MRIIDTYPTILTAYEGDAFHFEKWKAYMEAALPGAWAMCTSELKECLETGAVSWEREYLPVLNAVARSGGLRERAHDSFCRATKNLERTVCEKFGKSLDVDLIFYLGLCSGAGWVTEYRGHKAVFLGIEKIMELDWCGLDDMYGLLYHELGHVYQDAYGVLERTFDNDADSFLWQLFTEGVAMYFEQTLVGDPNYYHQDRDGWRQWCGDHLEEIKADFDRDLKTMTFADQRYFGDWVKYHGRGDVGYYLGCQLVRHMLSAYAFDDLIRLDMDAVARSYRQFIRTGPG